MLNHLPGISGKQVQHQLLYTQLTPKSFENPCLTRYGASFVMTAGGTWSPCGRGSCEAAGAGVGCCWDRAHSTEQGFSQI